MEKDIVCEWSKDGAPDSDDPESDNDVKAGEGGSPDDSDAAVMSLLEK